MLLAPLAASAPGAPVASGRGAVMANLVGHCPYTAEVAIEGATHAGTGLEESVYGGTGLLVLHSAHQTATCAHGLRLPAHFGFGQGYDDGAGNCRVEADGAAVCWHGVGWEDPESPDAWGRHMRLGPDGSFSFRLHEHGQDLRFWGTLVRTA